MRAHFCVVTLFALLGSTMTASIASANDGTPVRSFKEHVNRTKQFVCSVPQNRSYKIATILTSTELRTNEEIRPLYTVIRRCDGGTGCCATDSQICGPALVDGTEWEEVEVKVFDMVAKTPGVMKKLHIEHHKKCECRSKSDILSRNPNAKLSLN